ncbi:hypothetical protein MMC11_000500 [Xylographa trunciseda]|nr:hypothetical protein [Xylographa trunciseda]
MYLLKHRVPVFSVIIVLALENVSCIQSAWVDLNISLGGRLSIGTPLALPCFSCYNGQAVHRDTVACDAIQENYSVSAFRAEFFGGFMNSQDEICASNSADQCVLDDISPFDSLPYTNGTCNQGSVSPYYLDLQEPKDAITAFQFSSDTGVKLTIKNSGHDYMGRNSLKGSLALWTRNMRDMSYNQTFIPQGCSVNTAAYDTITVGAGVNFDEVYKYAEGNNVTFIGAYADTVGVSGGFVQMGGHSVLSPVYGLGIDRVVQYKVVTPDGVFRTANECQNEDLFWALKGGGGGTFGVVFESTHRVEKVLSLAVASLNFNQTESNVLPFLQLLVDDTATWGKQGWGGHLGPHNLINVTPLLSLPEAEASFKTVFDYALSQNGTASMEVLSWYQFYEKYVVPHQAPVGGGRVLVSRLIPTALFETPQGRAKIMAYLHTMLDAGVSPYIPVTTPILFPYVPGSTSATPAWRNSVWELATSLTWTWNSTVAEKRAVVALAAKLTALAKQLAPDSGSYGNEADPWMADWQEDFWGANYARLLAIKHKYDPEGLLTCWKCVGFEEGGTEDTFGCLESLG